MGLFNRKKNTTNEINNQELKEILASNALGTLVQGEHYLKEESMSCVFGYIFLRKQKYIEALFKITTDVGTFYFAAQKDSLIQLDFDEKMYSQTVENVISVHA